MTLGHEKLDAYQLAINYVAWVYQRAVSQAPDAWGVVIDDTDIDFDDDFDNALLKSKSNRPFKSQS